MLALPLLASAYDCQVDGIYYNLIPKGNVAEVTYQKVENGYPYSDYSGSVVIPEKFTYEGVEYSVTTIGERAFLDCTGLTSVTIPNSVTSIGEGAFGSCTGLTSVTIPNSVTSIGHGAFGSCTGLTSVTIPNSVTTIGDYAFDYCTGLTSVTIPSSITSIEDRAFSYCYSLTSITIPNSVTSIGGGAFYYCTGLTSVTIPNSVTSIGGYAFEDCRGLTSMTIGSGIRYIHEQAFAACNNLEEVYCLAENVPSTHTAAFEKSYPEYMTLYVPASSLNAYKTTEPWSLFGTIKAISGSGEEPTKCATPTISYGGKRLTFSCETEGVEYVYEIKDADIRKGYDAEVPLTATYEISVYATKSGYEDSDMATATLVWTNAVFTETTPETPTSAKAVAESIPMLISAQNGTITVRGEQNGLPLTVYTADGKMLGSATMKDGQASISTNLQRGEIAIVKAGTRSVKIKM